MALFICMGPHDDALLSLGQLIFSSFSLWLFVRNFSILFTDDILYFVFLDVCIDMLFDEDAILLSFFERFQGPEEEEDLKTEVIKYIK